MNDTTITGKSERLPIYYRYSDTLPESSRFLEELLKSSEIDQLFESYYRLTRIPFAIIDVQANVLLSSPWQRICTQFHRIHPVTCARCIECDTVLASRMEKGHGHAIYRCLNGLTDCASPIVIEERHVASVFIGQFLTQAPDEAQFRRQAEELGFDVTDYLAALREVPVVGEEQIPAILDLLTRMTRLVTNLTIAHKRAVEAQARQSLILDTIPQSVFWKDVQGRYLGCNRAFAKDVGLASPDEVIGKSDFDLPWPKTEAQAQHALDLAVVSANQPRLHVVELLQKADGTRTTVDTSRIPLTGVDGEACGVVGVYDDIADGRRTENVLRDRVKELACLQWIARLVDDEQASVEEILQRIVEIVPISRQHRGSAVARILFEGKAYETGKLDGCCAMQTSEILVHGRVRGAIEVGYQEVFDAGARVLNEDRQLIDTVARRIGCMIEARSAKDILKASERRFQSLFESIADAVFVADAESGLILDANSAALSLVGRSRDELISVHFSELHPMPMREELARVFADAEGIASRGESVHTLVLHASGREIPVEIRTSVSQQVGGRLCIIGVFRDVSERRRAEDAAREHAKFQRMLLEQMPVGMFIVDPETQKIEYANATGLALFGGESPDDLVGRPSDEIIRPAVPAAQSFLDLNQNIESSESELISADGRRRPILKSLLRVPMEGREKLLECFIDLTARKQAEEALQQSEAKLRGILDNLQDAVFRADLSGRVMLVNPAAPLMYRYGSEQEMIGLPAQTLYADPKDREILLNELRRNGTARDWVCRGRRSDDSIFWASMNVQFVRDQEGQIIGTEGVVRNITERMQAEEERQKLEEQLRSAQKMEAIGSLAGGVAHDFNNLLCVILSYTGFAIESLPEGSPVREDLVEVKKAGQRAESLTRQLLAFSRKQVLKPELLSLNQISEGLEKMLRRILGEDIDLVQHLAPDLGMVLADPGRMEQVLMNLVVNARDAMPEGGKLTIETHNVEIGEAFARRLGVKPGPYVELSVADTGVGMDEQTQAPVFEPFFTTKEKGRGTGLGLSTVHGIVKQSGGDIRVHSEVGQGTVLDEALGKRGMLEDTGPTRSDTDAKQRRGYFPELGP